MKKTKVINLWGAPGAGKSTAAAHLYGAMKEVGLDCELVTEFVKDEIWSENNTVQDNYAYILGNQSYRISRLVGKVDYIVTDSPIPLCLIYNKTPVLNTAAFEQVVNDMFFSFDNENILINRCATYAENGRLETEQESDSIAHRIIGMLTDYKARRGLDYHTFDGNIDGYQKLTDYILNNICGKSPETKKHYIYTCPFLKQEPQKKLCGGCEKTDGCVYTSIPPKVKCTVTGEFHNYDDVCNVGTSYNNLITGGKE